MQCHDRWTVEGARNGAVSEGFRYLCQRFSELLDAGGTYATSASFVPSSVVAVRELQQALEAHRASGGKNPVDSLVLALSSSTLAALGPETWLAQWYGAAYADGVASIQAIVDAYQIPGAVPAGLKASSWKRQRLAAARDQALRSLQALHSTMASNEGSDHLGKLADLAISKCRTEDGSVSANLDHVLGSISAEVLAQGRDGRRTARDVARIIRNAKLSDEAEQGFRTTLTRTAELFDVAFVLSGLSEVSGTEQFGVVQLGLTARWPIDGQSDIRLSDLIKSQSGRRSVVMSCRVRAFDYESARDAARRSAQVLIDQLVAQGRNGRFELEESFLIRKASSNRPRLLNPEGPFAERLAPRFPEPDAQFERSLRYAALGRHQTSSVVGVVQQWIALESLSNGSGASFLSKHLPGLLTLMAIRHGLATAWRIVAYDLRHAQGAAAGRAAELRQWIGVGHAERLNDIDRWTDVLRSHPGRRGPLTPESTPSEARAELDAILADAPPLARLTVEVWRRRLSERDTLCSWLLTVHGFATTTVLRMRLLRNGAVHSGVAESQGSRQLLQAANEVTDMVHEVVPIWTRRTSCTAAEAIAELSHRYEAVMREWQRAGGAPRISAADVTFPKVSL